VITRNASKAVRGMTTALRGFLAITLPFAPNYGGVRDNRHGPNSETGAFQRHHDCFVERCDYAQSIIATADRPSVAYSILEGRSSQKLIIRIKTDLGGASYSTPHTA